jgi:hypothetical protein
VHGQVLPGLDGDPRQVERLLVLDEIAEKKLFCRHRLGFQQF